MRIKLLVSRAGIDFSQSRGDEINVGDAEGLRMIAAEQAIAVVEEETPPPTPEVKTDPALPPATGPVADSASQAAPKKSGKNSRKAS